MKFDWLKRAFAVEKPPEGGVTPTPEQALIIDRVVAQLIRRRVTTPALLFLEMSRPLNYVGAQAMHFFMPIVDAVADPSGWNHFAAFLEQPGSIDALCRRIEKAEAEANKDLHTESAQGASPASSQPACGGDSSP